MNEWGHVLACAIYATGGDCDRDDEAMATKRKPGKNIPETQRTTVQVKLRLDVDVAEDLDALAARWGMNRSQCVARMVAAQHKSADSKEET